MSLDFNLDLLEKYDTQGPRYTSYPTAPEFVGNFGQQDYIRHAIRVIQSNAAPALLTSFRDAVGNQYWL